MYHDGGGRVGRREALERVPGLDEATWEAADRRFPVRITRSWWERVRAPDDPLARQVLPDADELRPDPGDVPDPVGDARLRPFPWVVRKHRDRVVLLVTKACHLHCRFCFRRDQHGGPGPTAEELAAAAAWVRDSGVREVILSGGDPLVLPDAALDRLLASLRPAVPLVRVHTRAPITAPGRVTPALARLLRAHAPVWVVVHANHAAELSPEVDAALARLADAGVPLLAQTVLLRGVNADPDALVELFEALALRRVQPYTLHHTDPVPGNARFRVSIDEGLAIWEAVRRRVGGLVLPRYVIDPPDGSGKVPVAEWAARRGAGG